MRAGRVLTVMLVVTVTASQRLRAEEAEAPVWREDTFVAWQAAQDTGRPLLLFVVADHCPYCKLMDRNTFSDHDVRSRLRDSFIAARVDAGRQPELARKLQVQAYPTTVVVNQENRVIGAIPGYVEPREFERRLAELTP
ncbi:MAG: thioredoxin family protein [Planctomycetes bacterium]|nr:thioredoxin family protein [Planctomycetota bacterium]